jgi:hypothetical protein
MVNPLIPTAIGLAGGAAIGYVLASAMGAKLPRIDLSRNTVPAGQTYDITCINFPPNAQLVAPQQLAPQVIVNLGWTDGNGTLILRGNVAQGPAGVYAIIAWNATDGRYCGVVTLIVT